MGRETAENQSGVNFLRTSYGRFVQNSTEDDKKAVERTNANGKQVFERFYSILSGYITNIELKEDENPDFSDKWKITIDDGEEVNLLEIPYSGAATDGLLTRLPNADPTKLSRIRVGDYEREGKNPGTWLSLDQSDAEFPEKGVEWVNVPKAHDRENPNGMPPLKEVTVNKKKVWDSSEKMEFLTKVIAKYLKGLKGFEVPKKPAVQTVDVEEETDDLPF
jgi:hypothetical protein